MDDSVQVKLRSSYKKTLFPSFGLCVTTFIDFLCSFPTFFNIEKIVQYTLIMFPLPPIPPGSVLFPYLLNIIFSESLFKNNKKAIINELTNTYTQNLSQKH